MIKEIKTKRIPIFIFCLVVIIGLFSCIASASMQIDQKMPISNKGVTDLYNALQALPNLGNVMLVGAHPDDEDNSLLTNLNRGYKVDASYVVSNWGEGGDNWIGPEFYGALGVVRSQELKSSRLYDQAKQFYFGAYDFGYSVSLAETLIDNNPVSPTYGQAGNWIWQISVYNLSRIIRKDRPDVIISDHWGYRGHGQHQACGYIVQKAYELAADPTYVIKDYDGTILPAWQVKKLYAGNRTYNRGIDGSTSDGAPDTIAGAPNLVIDSGVYDPILGMSYAEWGGLGRGMHKCQRVSPRARKGESGGTFYLKAKADNLTLADSGTLFGGIDISYDKIAKEITDPMNRLEIKLETNELKSAVSRMLYDFDPLNFLSIEPDIYKAKSIIKEIEALIATSRFNSEQAVVNGVTQQRLDIINDRLNTIASHIYGVSVDITCDDYDVVPSQTVVVTASVWVRTPGAQSHVTLPSTAMLGTNPTVIKVPSDWKVAVTEDPVDILQMGVVVGKTYVYDVTVPDNYKNYTGPFNAPYDEYMPSRNANFPFGSLTGDSSVWNSETQRAEDSDIIFGISTVGYDPYSSSPISAKVPFTVMGITYNVEESPDLRILPKITLLINNENSMLKKKSTAQTANINVVVKNNMTTAANDIIINAATSEWVGDSKTLSIASEGGEQTLTLSLNVPAGYEGSKKIDVTATLGSETFNEGFQVIDYNHIDRKNYYRASIQSLTVADFAVSDGLKLGYVVTGMDDYVVDYIRLMYNDPDEGANNVVKLTPEDLTNVTDLKSKFDTIVIGKMAWNSIPKIKAKVAVLIDFANAGGNLVVHYQNARVDNTMPLAPVPFPLGRTNINNENAKVMINFDTAANIQAHPFYYGIDLQLEGTTGPFESTASIWNGWMQQRTEWTAGTTDDPQGELAALGYTTLFYGNDPGDTSTGRPAVLYMATDNGGSYTYSSVVWERQLVVLAPGAYKLYANLLSMNKR